MLEGFSEMLEAAVNRPAPAPVLPEDPEQLAYSLEHAAKVTDCGTTALREAIATGELRAIRRGRSVRILREDLIGWLQKRGPALGTAQGLVGGELIAFARSTAPPSRRTNAKSQGNTSPPIPVN